MAASLDFGGASSDVAPLADASDDVQSDAGELSDEGADDAPVAEDEGPPPADLGSEAPDEGSTANDAGPSEDVDPPLPPPVWDLAMIQNASTANCTFTATGQVLKDFVPLSTWEVSYTSWESIEGTLMPITIKGFAARPAQQSSLTPGIVFAHGLGGMAKASSAHGLAALTGSFVIAYSGPGGGDAPNNTSEGLPSGHNNGYRMFDTVSDPRGSWFWGHAVAGMRAVTCLAAAPQVDPARLGMTGVSAGAVATLIASAVDDRLVASVPLSGTGAWDVATQSNKAWQHNLLTLAGLSTASAEWTTLITHIDSKNLLPAAQKTHVFMVNGSSDEFFPLTAHMATFGAIPGGLQKRTSLAGNFDHGCFPLVAAALGQSAESLSDAADLRARGAQRAWFAHHFGTDPAFAKIPNPPQVTVTPLGPTTTVTALVDVSASKLKVADVRVWWSNDDAFLWGDLELEAQGGGVWNKLALFPTAPNTVLYVDVLYETKDLIPRQFSVSSAPILPAGWVPNIHAIDGCN